MRPPEVANYLDRVGRVLAPGGRCLVTWFLLNDESRRLIAADRAELAFRYEVDGCLTANKAVPEEAIAHPQKMVEAMYHPRRAVAEEPIRYGGWCGRSSFLSYQDICVAGKAPVPDR